GRKRNRHARRGIRIAVIERVDEFLRPNRCRLRHLPLFQTRRRQLERNITDIQRKRGERVRACLNFWLRRGWRNSGFGEGGIGLRIRFRRYQRTNRRLGNLDVFGRPVNSECAVAIIEEETLPLASIQVHPSRMKKILGRYLYLSRRIKPCYVSQSRGLAVCHVCCRQRNLASNSDRVCAKGN